MIYLILIIVAITLLIGHIKKATIEMSPVFGIMIGVLYSFNEDEEVKEHWLQRCVFFVSITVIWKDPPNGLNM